MPPSSARPRPRCLTPMFSSITSNSVTVMILLCSNMIPSATGIIWSQERAWQPSLHDERANQIDLRSGQPAEASLSQKKNSCNAVQSTLILYHHTTSTFPSVWCMMSVGANKSCPSCLGHTLSPPLVCQGSGNVLTNYQRVFQRVSYHPNSVKFVSG